MRYYRKFIPRCSDIAQPLSKLTAHDAIFIWCEQCELSFQMLKDILVSAPILKYPDTSKPYTIFTDASKYGWAGVLTQEHTTMVDGKEITTKHPVMYVSGLFHGSQLNWAAMTKEVYAIYLETRLKSKIIMEKCLGSNNYKLGIFGCKIHCIYAKCFVNIFINIGIVLTTSIQGVVCWFSTQLSIFLWYVS